MPIQIGKDKNGCFIRWGSKGAKYGYICGDEKSKLEARKKAISQAVAIGEFSNEGLFHPNCRCKIVDGKLIKEADCCDYCQEQTI